MNIIENVIMRGIENQGLPKGFRLSTMAYEDLENCLANIPEQDKIPFTIAYTRGYSLAVNDLGKDKK